MCTWITCMIQGVCDRLSLLLTEGKWGSGQILVQSICLHQTVGIICAYYDINGSISLLDGWSGASSRAPSGCGKLSIKSIAYLPQSSGRAGKTVH